jgi:hypothetical protein
MEPIEALRSGREKRYENVKRILLCTSKEKITVEDAPGDTKKPTRVSSDHHPA